MPSSARCARLAVIAQLLQAPQQFGFFQAVRLLERWAGLERLQFHNSLSLSFPASEIESLQAHWTSPAVVGLPSDEGGVASSDGLQRIDLTPACMGLLGVSGALPLFYTEWLSQAEVRGRNDAARAFLDVFSHRSVSLFYQAWCKHRLGLRHEQEAVRHRRAQGAAPAPRAWVSEVLALSGLGLKGLRHRLGNEPGGVADETLAYFAGVLQQRTLPMVQLQRLLSHDLGVPLQIEPFVGRWYPVPRSGQTSLGGGAPAGCLGRSALLGERVWQRNLCIRLVLGPLDPARFLRFLPGGAGARALRQWLSVLLGPSLEVEVRLRLRQDAVQACVLQTGRSTLSGRLGWDTFLLTGPACSDRQDVHYDLHHGFQAGRPEPEDGAWPPSIASPASATDVAIASPIA